jgi:hypothetical protein
MTAGLAVGVGPAGVMAGAKLAEAGGRVGEQIPDNHQDGTGDGDQGPELAAAPDDPPVALAQEAVGPGGGSGGLAQCALEVGIALPGRPELLLGPDWMVRGDSFAQDTRCPAVGNRDMSRPTSARITWAV